MGCPKSKNLRLLKKDTLGNCQGCPLAKTRTNIVFGSGEADARILFVGEAPGAMEDRKGQPFVGQSGALLDGFLRRMNTPRNTVYITNVLKCRPPDNRDPEPEEVAACSTFLQAQIRIIQPEVIIALGRYAAVRLLDRKMSMDVFRRNLWLYDDPDASLKIPVFVTYHPSYLLRNRNKPLFKAVWADFQKAFAVTERLELEFDDDPGTLQEPLSQ